MTTIEVSVPPTPPGLPASRSRRRLFSPAGLLMAVVTLVIAWLSLGPLVVLVWDTLWDGQSVSWEAITKAYTVSGLTELAWNSAIYTVGQTAVAMLAGASLAYLVARTDIPLKGLVLASSLVPLIMPPVLYAIAWIYLASPRVGLINVWLEPLLGPGYFDVFSMTGMIVVEGLHSAPLVFLLMYAAFRNMDPSLEESALTSGASRLRVVAAVTGPLAKPALAAAGLVTLIRGLESFEVPALLGLPDGILVFMSRIWRALNTFPQDQATAGAYSIGLLMITAVGLYFYTRATAKSGTSLQTVTGKGFRPHVMPLGRWRWPLTAGVVLYFVIAVVLPFFILIYAATQPFYSVPTWDTLLHPSLANFETVLSRDSTIRAFQNSILLAVGSATAIMFVMSIAAWIVVRTSARGRWLLDLLAFLPFAIPGLVLGLAILSIYVNLPIPIYGTMWIIFLAYFTRFMPYGMRYVATSMQQIGAELEESAATSGATWLQKFRLIILPLIMPGVVAGWIYVVSVSIRELSSSLLLYSPGNEVVAIEIWALWENGDFSSVAAVGVLMTVLLVVIVLIARRIGNRFGVSGL